MKRVYHPTDKLIYKHIQQDSVVRLIFLSGMGSPVRQQRECFFRRFALTRGISYLALDYTQYARQFKSTEDFRIPTFLEKTEKILDNVPESKFLLFGACFGGLMGLQLSQRMPHRISGIVATSPAYELPTFPWAEKADAFLRRKVQEKAMAGNISYAQLKRLAILHQLFIATAKTIARIPPVKNYQGPITIFHGQNDPLIPVENSFRLQQALENPNLRLQIIPHAKHTVAFDKEMKEPLSILGQYLDNMKSPQK